MIVTAITQSSSVTIGLSIILVSQNILGLDGAIGIIVGSNLGTTSTAFLASMKLGKTVKRTAFVNLLFNTFGVIAYLPFYRIYTNLIDSIEAPIAMNAAYAHLIFNLTIAIMFMPFIKKIVHSLEYYWAKKAK